MGGGDKGAEVRPSLSLVRVRTRKDGQSLGLWSGAEGSLVKDAEGACERSDVLDQAEGRGVRLEGAQNNLVVLGCPQQAPSSLVQDNRKCGLDK